MRGFSATVLDLTADCLGTGTVDTYRFRVDYASGGAETAPSSFIGRFAPSDQVRRSVAFSLLHCQREYMFYTQLAGTVGVRAPRAYYASLDCPNRAMALVLEDLAPADRVSSWSVDQVASVLEQAAALHASRRGDPGLHRIPWLSDPSPPLSRLPAVGEVVYRALRERLATPLSPEGEAATRQLAQRLAAYYMSHTGPWAIQHGALHPSAMLRCTDGQFALVDWRWVSIGPAMLDVVFLLGETLTPGQCTAHERELLRHYHAALLRNGITDLSWERCWADYRLFVHSGLVDLVYQGRAAFPVESGDRWTGTHVARGPRLTPL